MAENLGPMRSGIKLTVAGHSSMSPALSYHIVGLIQLTVEVIKWARLHNTEYEKPQLVPKPLQWF